MRSAAACAQRSPGPRPSDWPRTSRTWCIDRGSEPLLWMKWRLSVIFVTCKSEGPPWIWMAVQAGVHDFLQQTCDSQDGWVWKLRSDSRNPHESTSTIIFAIAHTLSSSIALVDRQQAVLYLRYGWRLVDNWMSLEERFYRPHIDFSNSSFVSANVLTASPSAVCAHFNLLSVSRIASVCGLTAASIKATTESNAWPEA
jgi:hypothetical protein